MGGKATPDDVEFCRERRNRIVVPRPRHGLSLSEQATRSADANLLALRVVEFGHFFAELLEDLRADFVV
jgi:hypothetical protein